jgi:DeoR/GlpR family transcriptional regulator of sugar metabolism
MRNEYYLLPRGEEYKFVGPINHIVDNINIHNKYLYGKITSVSRKTVYDNLQKLIKAGLVKRIFNNYSLTDPTNVSEYLKLKQQ